jgi:Uma2 family endonuclease
MTTLTTKVRPEAADREKEKGINDNLWPLGWREGYVVGPDGKRVWQRQALTLEDILHPQLGDFQMASHEHEEVRDYLTNVFRARVADDPEAIVLSDTGVSWPPETGIKGHAPDVALIFNVRRRQNWATFDTAAEGTKPSLIIEITSPDTRVVDVERKYKHYAQVGVPFYAIVDLARPESLRRHIGYQLVGNQYEEGALDERGWLWLPAVNLWLGWRGKTVALYDEAGNLQEDYVALAAARTEAVRARQEAEKRAAEAEARLAELEARLRQLEGKA